MDKIEKELIAPCGMNCGVCARYLTLKNNIKGVPIPYCEGCRIRSKKCTFQKKCRLLKKDEIRFCYECKDFPCENLKRLDNRYQTNYNTSFIDNLNSIKKTGLSKFVSNEKKKWKCPKCKGTICIHNGLCFKCNLDKLKHKKRLYRWTD